MPLGKWSYIKGSQIDPNSKFNVANLELEWWIVSNNIPFPTWNTTNKSVASGSISENDFYFGWYKNMGGVIDTIGSKDQVRYSDKILEHCYQNGYPTYSYANAQSLGATGGRLDILAKGARQEYLRTGIMKKANIYIIISAENMANGDAHTFTGPKLLAAANQPNPFQYVENQAYTNIYGGMTAFQKQWLNLKGFVWFTKRCCYNAVKPK